MDIHEKRMLALNLTQRIQDLLEQSEQCRALWNQIMPELKAEMPADEFKEFYNKIRKIRGTE